MMTQQPSGSGDVTQCLRRHLALADDQSSFPAPTPGISQLYATPALGDLLSSSGLYRSLHTCGNAQSDKDRLKISGLGGSGSLGSCGSDSVGNTSVLFCLWEQGCQLSPASVVSPVYCMTSAAMPICPASCVV